ncbi:hypothetical protein [Streptomyces chrestomyceticus]|uniref:hypothetical protein n=1 Tax=Streptomyces chrestomyceticus TaxID=68185 RepID=UPI00378B5446
MPVTFTRSEFPSLYWGGAGAPAVGYLLPRGEEPAVQTIAFEESWRDYAGCYVFVNVRPPAGSTAQQKFARQLWKLLDDEGLSRTWMLWVEDPTRAGPPVMAAALSFVVPDGGGFADVRRLSRFELGDLAVGVAPGCTVRLYEGTDHFDFTPAEGHPRGVYLAARSGAALLDVVTGNLTIPVGGPLSGCLRFDMDVDEASLDRLDVGLRVFHREPFGGCPDEKPFFVDSLRYPVFAGRVKLSAVVDPLDPAGAGRTRFEMHKNEEPLPSHYRTVLGHRVTLTPKAGARLVFAPRPAHSGAGPPPSRYLVPAGDFTLTVDAPAGVPTDLMCGLSGVEYLKLPSDGTHVLRFQPGRPAFAPGFTPAGTVSHQRTGPALTPLATTSWVHVLHTGSPAGGISSGDSSDSGDSGDSGDGVPLDYCAQPDDSVLHQPAAEGQAGTVGTAGTTKAAATAEATQTAGGTAETALSYLEVVSGQLPYDPPAEASSFPMLPYAGAAAGRAVDLAQMEHLVVAAARRKAIAAMEADTRSNSAAPTATPNEHGPPAEEPDAEGATPLGLRATFSSDHSVIKSVLLAVDPDEDPSPGTGEETPGGVYLRDIASGSELWTALWSSQLFLVASDPDSLSAHMDEDSALTAAGWPFRLHPDHWRGPDSAHPTFLIVKYGGACLRDLAGQLGAWCEPDHFNVDAAQACAALTAFIDKTIKEHAAGAEAAADLGHFVRTVLLDPDWNGTVVLNAATAMDAWPAQLRALAAGIDPARLVAHHVGVHATPVRTVPARDGKGPSLLSRPSSVFALIDYKDPEPLPAGTAPYDFKVLTLKARIANSKLAKFSSTVDFQVNSLFGAGCELAGDPDANNLLLYGSYQHADGKPAYVFRTGAGRREVFALSDAVLRAVAVNRAQLVTVTGQDDTRAGPPERQPVTTRLVLSGVLDLAESDEFDAFSFGSRSQEQPGSAGLSVTDLAVVMTVHPSPDPKRRAGRTFAFDAAHLVFDPATSTARAGSLYDVLPLQLGAFVQAEGGGPPTDLGYAPVTTPLGGGRLSAPWYGLVLALELGSLGSWAEQSRLDARLLLAWSPAGADRPVVFVGLGLPGLSGGNRTFDLQGPLKLTIKNIALERIEREGGMTYLLWLQSIGLGAFRFTLPPSGRTDLLLFANREEGGRKALGWYAAYDKSGSSDGGQGPQRSGASLPSEAAGTSAGGVPAVSDGGA